MEFKMMSDPTLTPEALDRLEALAMHIAHYSPSPWKTTTNRDFGPWDNKDSELPTDANDESVRRLNWKEACLFSAYVRHLDPDTVRALVAGYRRMLALEKLRAAVQGLDSVDMGTYYHVAHSSWEELFRANAALEKPDAD